MEQELKFVFGIFIGKRRVIKTQSWKLTANKKSVQLLNWIPNIYNY
jgi:hypothetical protein